MGAELFEGPVGDVLAAVSAIFGIGVEGEALRPCLRQEVRYPSDSESENGPVAARLYPEYGILFFAWGSGEKVRKPAPPVCEDAIEISEFTREWTIDGVSDIFYRKARLDSTCKKLLEFAAPFDFAIILGDKLV